MARFGSHLGVKNVDFPLDFPILFENSGFSHSIALEAILGPNLAILGPNLGQLGAVLGGPGAVLGGLGAVLASLGPLLAALGVLLGRSWPLVGRSWRALGLLWGRQKCSQSNILSKNMIFTKPL